MMVRLWPILMLAGPAIAATAPADAAPRRTSASGQRLTVVSAGADQALRLGTDVLSRPFGGQLVDRLTVVGRYALPGRQTVWLVRGDGGAECPARYLIVSRRPGEAPVPSPSFGTCSVGAAARVQRGELIVTMPDATGRLVRFGWAQGAIKPLAVPGPTLATLPTPCSADAPRSPELRDQALVALLPLELRRGSGIRRADLDDAVLQAMVVDLACIASWPGAEPVVPRAATPLFASKRYGAAAFAALDTVARAPGADTAMRAALRSFSARMYYYVGRREPI